MQRNKQMSNDSNGLCGHWAVYTANQKMLDEAESINGHFRERHEL